MILAKMAKCIRVIIKKVCICWQYYTKLSKEVNIRMQLEESFAVSDVRHVFKGNTKYLICVITFPSADLKGGTEKIAACTLVEDSSLDLQQLDVMQHHGGKKGPICPYTPECSVICCPTLTFTSQILSLAITNISKCS